MTATQPRPRIVNAAFWCWAAAAVLLVAFGLLLAFSTDPLPVLFRGVGGLFALSGLGLGYLAGQTRLGRERFRRAAVGLSLAIVVLVAVFCIGAQGLLWLLPMILTMVAAVLMMRPSAQEWFDHEEPQ